MSDGNQGTGYTSSAIAGNGSANAKPRDAIRAPKLNVTHFESIWTYAALLVGGHRLLVFEQMARTLTSATKQDRDILLWEILPNVTLENAALIVAGMDEKTPVLLVELIWASDPIFV